MANDPPRQPIHPATTRRVARRSHRVGPNQSAAPPPRPAPGGARSKENSGAISECYSHLSDEEACFRMKSAMTNARRLL